MSYIFGKNSTAHFENGMPCGCKLFTRHSAMTSETRTVIEYCPMHKTAPKMYEALRAVWEDGILFKASSPPELHDKVREALAEVEVS